MKILPRLLLVFVISLFFTQTSQATHLTGGDFNWQCVGQDSFLVTLNLFRDCNGANAPNPNALVNITSSCGTTMNNVQFPLTNPGGTQVSQLCPNQLPFSTCNGGTLTGNQIYTYQALVVLTPVCPNGTWTFSWSTCCRPGGVVNVTGSNGAGLYISAQMFYGADSCNNSPAFVTNPADYPLQYVCSGTNYVFNAGVSEPDGDSLVYSLVPALINATTPVNYINPPYSATNPIPGIVLDSFTGEISFLVPPTLGTYIVKYRVDEYERCTGEHKGWVARDIQFVVIPPGTSSCASPQDTICIDTSNFSGTASLVDNKTIEMCVGQTFSFTLNIFDPDHL